MQQNWQKHLPRSTFISRSSFKVVHCGEKFNRFLVDITLKSRKMVNHRLLVIIKLLIDSFYVKTREARRTITACVDSVVNFSLVSSLASHLLSKIAADDSFLLRKMSIIWSGLVEVILSGMWKDIGRH